MKDKEFIKSYFESEYCMNINLDKIVSKIRKEKMMERNRALKIVATFMLIIGITAGVVYAGAVVYDKVIQNVFKEPEKINYLEELKVSRRGYK